MRSRMGNQSFHYVEIIATKGKITNRNTMSTLYIVEPGSALKVKHQQFQVFQQNNLLLKLPVTKVSHIILFGYCHLSHGAVQTALFRQIPVTYYSAQGYYQGNLKKQSQPKASYLVRQVKRQGEIDFIHKQALAIVRAKLSNSRILLMRLNRRNNNSTVRDATAKIKQIINCLNVPRSLESIRGYEGNAANLYFQGICSLFKGDFYFSQRSSRPPKDPVNSLLGFGYTLLCQHLIATVQSAGLHTDFGNLHISRDNHPALVLDIMEEFRAQIVDSLVIYLVNKKIFSPEDFTHPDANRGVYLKRDSLKTFLEHWSHKMTTELTHPQTQRKVSLRGCLELQVQDYLSCLLGKKETYQPMIWIK